MSICQNNQMLNKVDLLYENQNNEALIKVDLFVWEPRKHSLELTFLYQNPQLLALFRAQVGEDFREKERVHRHVDLPE